ncbi:MAG: hypothetical protein ACLFWR_04565 [Acidimicrobiales bacterium]
MRPPSETAVPPVPIQEAVAEFFSALLGLGTAASKAERPRLEPDGSHIVGTYRDDLGQVAALVTADLVLAASAGAALAAIPPSAARDAVKTGALDENLLENFREVSNVMSSLLNTPATPHLTLVDVWPSDHPDLPTEAWDVLANPTKRREYAVTIEGYDDGHLGIVIR